MRLWLISQKAYLVWKSELIRLELNLEDRIAPFVGFGYCFNQIKNYEESFLCFSVALEILFNLQKEESEKFAFLLNNIGCVLFEAKKAFMAFDYFKLAEIILCDKKGSKNLGTMVVRANLEKSLAKNSEYKFNDSQNFRFFIKGLDSVKLTAKK